MATCRARHGDIAIAWQFVWSGRVTDRARVLRPMLAHYRSPSKGGREETTTPIGVNQQR
jgi:hypothetical protein